MILDYTLNHKSLKEILKHQATTQRKEIYKLSANVST